MAALGIYYIDADTLIDAITVYDDVDMLIPAADGWYADSLFVRKQTSGILSPPIPVICPP